MKEITAVEWLFEQVVNRTERVYFLKELEQAKEMEKQQLEKFYNHGQWAIIEHGHGDEFDEYYNQTFSK